MTEEEKQQVMAPTVEEAKRLAKCEYIWMGRDGRWQCDWNRHEREKLMGRTVDLKGFRTTRDTHWVKESILCLMDMALAQGDLEDVQSVDDLLVALEGSHSERQFTGGFGDDR